MVSVTLTSTAPVLEPVLTSRFESWNSVDVVCGGNEPTVTTRFAVVEGAADAAVVAPA